MRTPQAQRLYDAYFTAVGNPRGRDVFEVMAEALAVQGADDLGVMRDQPNQ